MEHATPLAQARQDLLLARYIQRIHENNPRLGLVSPHVLPEAERILLNPSLALAQLPLFDAEHLTVVDVGSGGGLPGIPLAILRPQVNLLLVDSQLKKCRFLESVRDELELSHVEVLHARVEKVRDRPSPDLFIARFFKDLRRLAAWTRRWRQAGTRYLIFAGEEDQAQAQVYDLSLQNRHPLGAGKVAHEYLAT